MSDLPLQGCRVLVVEDEFLLADELRSELEQAGAVVIGPIGDLAGAMALASTQSTIDAAVLDLNLGGAEVFPLADVLSARGVPLIFSTGYDAVSLPSRYANVPTCVKPMSQPGVVAALQGAMTAR